MPPKKIILLSLFVLIIIYAVTLAYDFDKETEKVMPFVNSYTHCLSCHDKSEISTRLKNPAKSCDVYCLKCHKNMNEHHPVGAAVKGSLPEKIILSEKGKIACFSCHNLNIVRFDSVSWRAESLYESIFHSRGRYKTYFLVIKNSNGELCRKCH